MKNQGDKIRYTGDWHYSVSKKFVFNTNLSRNARFLYLFLLSFTNKEKKEAFPSREYIKNIMICSERSVTNYLKELKKKGYLKMRKERSQGVKYKHNVYELFDYPQNDHTPYMADGKNENLTTCHFTMMVNGTTKIIQYLKNNISIAQLLIKDSPFNEQEFIFKISKLVNKYKSALGEDKLRRILVYLLGEILNGREQFISIDKLGSYLGGCVKNQGQITDNISEIKQGVEQWIK